jgi:uncharacterized repeat protein (TIGR02543 family)
MEDEGTEVAKPAKPTKDGFDFLGWFDAETGGTTYTWPHTLVEDATMHAQWKPGVSVHITLQPQPEDHPALSNVSIFENEDAQFSAAGTYTSWQWRWDGTLIDDADSDTYALETLAARLKTPGVHELSVKVSAEGGQILSARCRVIIKAQEGGAE